MSNTPDDQEPGWDFLNIILWPVSAWVTVKQWVHDRFSHDDDDSR